MAAVAAKVATVGLTSAVVAKSAVVVSTTGLTVVLLLVVHVVPVVARLDLIEVLTIVGTIGANDSAGVLAPVATRYCSLITTRKRCPISPSPRGEYTESALLISSSCMILMLV